MSFGTAPVGVEANARPQGPYLLGLGLCVVLVLLGVAFLDRPVSTWVHTNLAGQKHMFDALTHIVDPLLPLSTLGLLLAGVAALGGWRPGPRAKILLATALSVTIAVTLKDQAKYVFGRLWPETWVDNNPSWIGTGSYGFFPFHGGRGWSSFPSGHMSVVAAPAEVVRRRLGPWGWLAIVATGIVAIGLLGADYHFFSDIVAGTVVGWACGTGALALVFGALAQPARSAP